MFAEHRKRSDLTKSIQEAIKLLNIAGMELDATSSAELLRAGGVSEVVIQGVQKVAINSRQGAESEGNSRINEVRYKSPAAVHIRGDGANSADLLSTVTSSGGGTSGQNTDTAEPNVPLMSMGELDAYLNR